MESSKKKKSVVIIVLVILLAASLVINAVVLSDMFNIGYNHIPTAEAKTLYKEVQADNAFNYLSNTIMDKYDVTDISYKKSNETVTIKINDPNSKVGSSVESSSFIMKYSALFMALCPSVSNVKWSMKHTGGSSEMDASADNMRQLFFKHTPVYMERCGKSAKTIQALLDQLGAANRAAD